MATSLRPVTEERIGLEDVPAIADVHFLSSLPENGSQPEEQADSWAPQNLAELDERPPVEPTLGGLGLVYPGKRHVFSGPQESAKTLAAYVIALEVVRAGDTAWLIDFEMGPWDARTRLRELGATVDELGAIRYVEPDRKANSDVIGKIVADGPGLVVIDAVAGAFDLHELDDNKRQDVERFAGLWLQPLRKAGIATIVLDHVVKSTEGRGAYAIGSERKIAGTDVHLGFEVVHPIKRGSHGLYKVVTHKDRGGYLKRGKLAEFDLQSDPETNAIAWAFKAPVETDAEHPFRPTTLMEKVSRFLERMVDGPVTTNTVTGASLGKAEYVREALKVLVDEGYVEVSDGPNRSRLYESILAYREEFDTYDSGASPVRPGASQEDGSAGASVRPTPFRGDVHAAAPAETYSGASQSVLEEDDGIPF